jgi:uncharacterized protein YacL
MSELTTKGGEIMNFLTDISALILTLVLIGFLTETLVEILKQFVIKQKMSAMFVYTLSIVIGLVLAFALQVSLFTKENAFAYYVGVVICGLVASRGSNYVHNFIGNMPKK